MFRIVVSIIVGFSFFSSANAQFLWNSGRLIQGGIDDGVKLYSAYLKPLNKSLMVGMNNNTYQRYGYENKRFSISLHTNVVFIPKEDQSFHINNLKLKHLEAYNGNKDEAPTVFGSKSSTKIGTKTKIPDITVFPPSTKPLFTLSSPKGIGQNFMVLPFIDISYHFDKSSFSVGFIPFITLPNSDVKLSHLSLNGQQDITGLLGIESKPFKISLAGGYSIFNATSDLDIQPDDVLVNIDFTGNTSAVYSDQKFQANYQSISVSSFLSYEKKWFTIFTGLGYNYAFSDIKLKGVYPIYYQSPGNLLAVNINDVEDPIGITDHYARIKAEIGFRLDLSRFYIQTNYTIADYGGIGFIIGVRL